MIEKVAKALILKVRDWILGGVRLPQLIQPQSHYKKEKQELDANVHGSDSASHSQISETV